MSNLVSNMLNKLQGQPESYDKKFVVFASDSNRSFNIGADPSTSLGGHWVLVPMELCARLNSVEESTP